MWCKTHQSKASCTLSATHQLWHRSQMAGPAPAPPAPAAAAVPRAAPAAAAPTVPAAAAAALPTVLPHLLQCRQVAAAAAVAGTLPAAAGRCGATALGAGGAAASSASAAAGEGRRVHTLVHQGNVLPADPTSPSQKQHFACECAARKDCKPLHRPPTSSSSGPNAASSTGSSMRPCAAPSSTRAAYCMWTRGQARVGSSHGKGRERS